MDERFSSCYLCAIGTHAEVEAFWVVVGLEGLGDAEDGVRWRLLNRTHVTAIKMSYIDGATSN